MAENTGELKTLLESILGGIEETKTASDKQLEAQLAFNSQINQELQHLLKQIVLTCRPHRRPSIRLSRPNCPWSRSRGISPLFDVVRASG